MLCLFFAYQSRFRRLPTKGWWFSCVTVVTGITGPSFISQDIRSDLPAFFQNAVEYAATESKKKRSVAALCHLQYFMQASNNYPINLEDLTHDHMTQYFWGSVATYMGKYAGNNTKVKFSDDNSSALKKSVKSRRKTKTASFLNNSSPRCARSKTDIFWKL